MKKTNIKCVYVYRQIYEDDQKRPQSRKKPEEKEELTHNERLVLFSFYIILEWNSLSYKRM